MKSAARSPALLAGALVAALLPAAAHATAACLGQAATIEGSAGADVLRGTAGPDVIAAGEGNDQIWGYEGNDLICAGPGDDTVAGGPGDDDIDGGDGNDRLYGGPGADFITAGVGNDLLGGGGGRDHLAAAHGTDTLHGGPEDDVFRGGLGNDTLDGGGGADDLKGGPGADRLVEVLLPDTIVDAGTPDSAGDTRSYQSLTLEPLDGTYVVFPNSASGHDQHHTRPVSVRNAPGGLVLVERISPEEYLLGLGEMPYSWHPAALRAQAIAARTYLANLVSNPPWGLMAEFGFDICASPSCQLYLGAGNAAVAPDGWRWAEAVAASADKILMYGGAPILAVYHSTAGATTRSVQDVWPGSAALPYLQAVTVPVQDSPFARWSFDLRLDQFLAILARADMTFAGTVTWIATTVTAPGGGPYRVRFQTTRGRPVDVTVDRIQAAMNTYGPVLYPTLLPAVRPDGKRYPQVVLSPTYTLWTLNDGVTVHFDGQGWGHQLGLPQYGAQAMALAGSGTGAILSHFYSGLWPVLDPGFLPPEVEVGLAWDRSTVTLSSAHYVLRSSRGVVARDRNGTFVLGAGADGTVLLASP